jgi:hypothetical protein
VKIFRSRVMRGFIENIRIAENNRDPNGVYAKCSIAENNRDPNWGAICRTASHPTRRRRSAAGVDGEPAGIPSERRPPSSSSSSLDSADDTPSRQRREATLPSCPPPPAIQKLGGCLVSASSTPLELPISGLSVPPAVAQSTPPWQW